MLKVLRAAGARKPVIHISESDYDLIANYAISLEARSPALAKMLLDEIDRAKVSPDDRLPPDVAALGSEVTYLDESSGAVMRVRLVMPAEADIGKGKISLLTPIGAGLVGLKAGQSIDWPCPDGRPRTLSVIEVRQAP